MRAVELLQYILKPGTGREFHTIMVEISAPLHRGADIDIIAFGNSIHDEDFYFLIRAFDDIEHMKASQEKFYMSDKWPSRSNHRTNSNQRKIGIDATDYGN
ncbi:NIPSNAP family protein [Pantoea sp. PNT03]|uniref:NIPSNAP family protein n=1 Tax=Pantoea sp. PNT03 TaxID=2769258 RepID=UPI00351C7717